MKKTLLLLIIGGMLSFVACQSQEKKEEVKTEEQNAPTKVDENQSASDSSKVAKDSTAKQ